MEENFSIRKCWDLQFFRISEYLIFAFLKWDSSGMGPKSGSHNTHLHFLIYLTYTYTLNVVIHKLLLIFQTQYHQKGKIQRYQPTNSCLDVYLYFYIVKHTKFHPGSFRGLLDVSESFFGLRPESHYLLQYVTKENLNLKTWEVEQCRSWTMSFADKIFSRFWQIREGSQLNLEQFELKSCYLIQFYYFTLLQIMKQR